MTTPIRLTLVQKMIFSFAVSGICLTAALVYTLSGLESMHRTEEDIARKDLAAITLTIKLRDSILTQERSLGRYRILKELTFKELFDQNALQFTKRWYHLHRYHKTQKFRAWMRRTKTISGTVSAFLGERPFLPMNRYRKLQNGLSRSSA